MLAATLGASLLGNMLTGKRINKNNKILKYQNAKLQYLN